MTTTLGSNQHEGRSIDLPSLDQDRAASLFSVSTGSIKRAAAIRRAVEKGDLADTTADYCWTFAEFGQLSKFGKSRTFGFFGIPSEKSESRFFGRRLHTTTLQHLDIREEDKRNGALRQQRAAHCHYYTASQRHKNDRRNRSHSQQSHCLAQIQRLAHCAALWRERGAVAHVVSYCSDVQRAGCGAGCGAGCLI